MTSRTTNRKTMLKEKNQSLLSWELSQPPPYAHTKSEPAAVVTRQEQQEATTHCGSEFEYVILTLTKDSINF